MNRDQKKSLPELVELSLSGNADAKHIESAI